MKEIKITEDTQIQLPGCILTCYIPIGANQTTDVGIIPQHRWQFYGTESAISIKLEAKDENIQGKD